MSGARPLSARRESPEPGNEVTLLVKVSKPASEEVLESISDIGGDIEKELGYDYLRVSINEERLDGLFGLKWIESVEIEGLGGTLDSGNFNSQFDSGQ